MLCFVLSCMCALWVTSYWYCIGVAINSDGRIYFAETWHGRVQVNHGEGEFADSKKWMVYRTTLHAKLPFQKGFRFKGTMFWTWWLLPIVVCGCAAYWLMVRLYPSLRIPLGKAARRQQR